MALRKANNGKSPDRTGQCICSARGSNPCFPTIILNLKDMNNHYSPYEDYDEIIPKAVQENLYGRDEDDDCMDDCIDESLARSGTAALVCLLMCTLTLVIFSIGFCITYFK